MLNQDPSVSTAGRKLFGTLAPDHKEIELGGCRGVRRPADPRVTLGAERAGRPGTARNDYGFGSWSFWPGLIRSGLSPIVALLAS